MAVGRGGGAAIRCDGLDPAEKFNATPGCEDHQRAVLGGAKRANKSWSATALGRKFAESSPWNPAEDALKAGHPLHPAGI